MNQGQKKKYILEEGLMMIHYLHLVHFEKKMFTSVPLINTFLCEEGNKDI